MDRAIRHGLGICLAAGMMQTGSARAEPWVDYDILMEQHADEVVTTTDANGRRIRRLDLGDGLAVSCRDDVCRGTDTNTDVRAGCDMGMLIGLMILAEVCPDFLDADKRLVVTERFDRVGAFVFANGVPAREWAEARSGLLEEVRGSLGTIEPAQCDEARSLATIYGNYLASPDAEAHIDRITTRPRLTFADPCL